MDAAIIAIGSEMLTPQRVDTNSLFLTDHLNGLGVEVVSKMVVGDDLARLVEAMRFCLASAELLILSGGLGPTEDDLTREAVARLCQRPLVFSEEIGDWLVKRFAQMNRKMAEVNKRQAFVVEGAAVLSNGRGTAPGQWVEYDGKHILMLPGPPHEIKAMFQKECLPRLKALLPVKVIRTRFYRVAGMGESDLDQLIAPLYRNYTNPATTILAAAGDIQVHLRARCSNVEEAERLLREVGDPIAAALGDRIYSTNGDSLEATIGWMLRERALQIAVAESCTGGMLGEKITVVPGSSDYFLGGFVTYTYAAKTHLLGVPAEMLSAHGAVSEPVAKAMAEGVLARTGAGIGVSVTGVAGPEQGGEREPVGTVFIGVAWAGGCQVRRFQFPGDRQRIRTIAAQTAMDMVRRFLIKSAGAPWQQA